MQISEIPRDDEGIVMAEEMLRDALDRWASILGGRSVRREDS